MTEKYEDIINLPHHVSKTRPQMSMLERAAQFSPFAALNGYDDAVKETGRLTDERIELGDEERDLLDRKQQYLQEIIAARPEITVTFSSQTRRSQAVLLLISRIGRYPAIGGDSNFADFLPGDGRDEFDLRHQQNPLSG